MVRPKRLSQGALKGTDVKRLFHILEDLRKEVISLRQEIDHMKERPQPSIERCVIISGSHDVTIAGRDVNLKKTIYYDSKGRP